MELQKSLAVDLVASVIYDKAQMLEMLPVGFSLG